MNIDLDHMSLQEELEVAIVLVCRIRKTIASGYQLIHDEPEAAEHLRMCCGYYCETYDDRI